MKKNTVFTYKVGRGVYINLTNRCTNRCDFCIRQNGDGVYGSDTLWLEREPSASEVLEDIKKYDPSSYDEFVFCGYGEPTMRMEVLSSVGRELKKLYGKPVRLNTNGQACLINGRDVTPMLEGAVDIVSISLNAADAEKYDAVCHSVFGPAAFDAILDFARRCAPYVKTVVLSVVDTTLPEADIAVCERLASSVGAVLRVRRFDTGKETR